MGSRFPSPPRSTWFRRLASAKLAAWLIGVLALITVLGVIIPQRTLLTPDMMADFESSMPAVAEVLALAGLDALYSGWPLALITALLAVNLIACTWRRLAAYLRGPSLSTAPPHSPVPLAGRSAANAITDSIEYLEVRGWNILSDEDRVLAIKGRRGFWGSMVLHGALLVIMIGGVAATLTHFTGEVVLAEGQSLSDAPESYLYAPLEPEVGEAYSGATLTLDRMRFFYEGDELVRAVATISGTTVDGGTSVFETRVNYPLEIEGKSFLLQNSGLTADLTVNGPLGSNPISVNLAEETPFGWEDRVTVPTVTGTQELVLLAAPVPLEAGETLPARKFEVTEPRLGIFFADDPGQQMFAALVPGQSVEIAEGVTLTFEGVRFWSRFLVRADDARWIVYLGLWLSVIGTAWRFVQPERHLSVSAQMSDSGEAELVIGYRARPWRGMILAGDRDDMDRLAGSSYDTEGQR
jgi:cytochrome c biogenesis protein ResB